ncbi:MAG: FliA/WhiG family RNA polymerase sigma factor [Deltaproteobacteria bacterium]
MIRRKPVKAYQSSASAATGAEIRSPERADREEIIREYLPMVKYLAGVLRMRIPPHIEMDDLVSSGVVGLLNAIDRFDPARGIKFRTYAEFRIRGAMLDYLREMDWFPRSARKSATLLQQAYTDLEHRHGKPPSDREVADHLGWTLESLHRELAALSGLTVFSLDAQPDGDSEDAVYRILAKAAMEESKEEELLRELRDILGRSIDDLPEKEKTLIALYYYEDLTMKEIGSALSLGEARISQLHSQAILRLRGKLKEHFEE